MAEENKAEGPKPADMRSLIHDAIREFVSQETAKSEPAYKAELEEERRRREALERRMNELVEENRRSRQAAEEAERQSTVRAELQRLGVNKVDLAFKAVKDEIQRTPDGRLVGRTGQGEVGLKEYLSHFVTENPELLPARITGGSGASGNQRHTSYTSSIDLDSIRPGMPKEELERARQEIARIALQMKPGS
jgi:ribosomal protein S18